MFHNILTPTPTLLGGVPVTMYHPSNMSPPSGRSSYTRVGPPGTTTTITTYEVPQNEYSSAISEPRVVGLQMPRMPEIQQLPPRKSLPHNSSSLPQGSGASRDPSNNIGESLFSRDQLQDSRSSPDQLNELKEKKQETESHINQFRQYVGDLLTEADSYQRRCEELEALLAALKRKMIALKKKELITYWDQNQQVLKSECFYKWVAAHREARTQLSVRRILQDKNEMQMAYEERIARLEQLKKDEMRQLLEHNAQLEAALKSRDDDIDALKVRNTKLEKYFQSIKNQAEALGEVADSALKECDGQIPSHLVLVPPVNPVGGVDQYEFLKDTLHQLLACTDPRYMPRLSQPPKTASSPRASGVKLHSTYTIGGIPSFPTTASGTLLVNPTPRQGTDAGIN